MGVDKISITLHTLANKIADTIKKLDATKSIDSVGVSFDSHHDYKTIQISLYGKKYGVHQRIIACSDTFLSMVNNSNVDIIALEYAKSTLQEHYALIDEKSKYVRVIKPDIVADIMEQLKKLGKEDNILTNNIIPELKFGTLQKFKKFNEHYVSNPFIAGSLGSGNLAPGGDWMSVGSYPPVPAKSQPKKPKITPELIKKLHEEGVNVPLLGIDESQIGNDAKE